MRCYCCGTYDDIGHIKFIGHFDRYLCTKCRDMLDNIADYDEEFLTEADKLRNAHNTYDITYQRAIQDSSIPLSLVHDTGQIFADQESKVRKIIMQMLDEIRQLHINEKTYRN